MRFLTVTPNPAIDTVYRLDHLAPGGINRVSYVLPQPGGKGNNVARVLTALGHAPVATGFAGGHAGKRMEDGLSSQGIRPEFVPVTGETRVCLTIVEAESGCVTEIREPGAPVTAADADRLLARVTDLATDADAVVLSGSLPPGMPPGFTSRLIAAARRAGAFVAFDASGEALRLGLAGHPDLIKPNRDELEDLIGATGGDAELIAAVQTRLLGPLLSADAAVLVSLGERGAVLIRHDRAVHAVPPRITPIHTVGCGDALLAGFLDARARGLDERDAPRHAVAVGTAAALQEAVAVVDTTDVVRIETAVRVSFTTTGSERPSRGEDDIHPRAAGLVTSHLEGATC